MNATKIAPFAWQACPSGYRFGQYEECEEFYRAPGQLPLFRSPDEESLVSKWGMADYLIPLSREVAPIGCESDVLIRLVEIGECARDMPKARRLIESFVRRNGLLYGGHPENVLMWLYATRQLATAFHQWELIDDGDGQTETSNRLQEELNRNLRDGVFSCQIERSRRGGFDLAFAARNLLAFCWLQLAEAATGSRLYRQCENCNQWIIISPEGPGRRQERRLCSTRCKTQIYLKRKEARRLRKQRVPIAEIARRMGRDVEVVTSWLKVQPKKKGQR
jgi:hypothetical protein